MWSQTIYDLICVSTIRDEDCSNSYSSGWAIVHGLFASGKSVGGRNCFCPCLPITGCSRPCIPPGECCPRCRTCKPTGEISYDDNGNLLSWKPSPCEFCTCVNGRLWCVIQDSYEEDVVRCALQGAVIQLVTYFMTAMVFLVGDLILVPTAAVSMVVHHVIYETVLLLHVQIM